LSSAIGFFLGKHAFSNKKSAKCFSEKHDILLSYASSLQEAKCSKAHQALSTKDDLEVRRNVPK